MSRVGFSPNDSFFFTGVDAPMSRADKVGAGALQLDGHPCLQPRNKSSSALSL